MRNAKSGLSLTLNQVKTQCRIVLTGTPLQNNLLECKLTMHCSEPSQYTQLEHVFKLALLLNQHYWLYMGILDYPLPLCMVNDFGYNPHHHGTVTITQLIHVHVELTLLYDQ